MEPPSYEEATAQRQPPPSYEETITLQPGPTSILSAPTETPILTPQVTCDQPGTVQPDPFPILTTPTATTTQTPRFSVPQLAAVSTVPAAQAVVTQPQPTIPVSDPPNSDGYIRCSKCQREVKPRKVFCPSSAAIFVCTMTILSCLFCGCCLIPFFIPGCWNTHYFCPHCRKHLRRI
ncbi:lipopolysaccharide-induced tumor necrosis factor-alpha factor homolog [Hippocampus zosterae]|uniref:lipopolysaccharide-induced tumor necrosis factor-alpha factor homolog n=1 Tax=Hippocampus zosterae TaxID=109293 RepID=UPI00223DD448|nr:lipopolysaccharide-induced tumor necrosis factor-alpha factor homolog [Hippocampus zosterae]XP_051939673.1 lipopolysaccharide-induced tumor necrosis factor-alpha factor homolog [Hippocampus zosterae]XP_051939674.1 lipopolysaccharide-induced tumor necrosis factor-alpha factor homolog [Hippocampus zosterae]